MAGFRLSELSRADLERAPGASVERALEEGQVLTLAPGVFAPPPESDLVFLREELGRRASLKNISYHPEGDFLSGLKGDAATRERTRAILREYGRRVATLLTRLCPRYAAGWHAGKVNFRPFEEQGRDLPAHSSNELVHVDAFASGATHGGRILRFFTNVHPERPRVWRTAGTFAELFPEFGPRAGITGRGLEGLRERLPDRALTGLVRLCTRAGLAPAALLDTSPYDRAMKRMHDTLKDDAAFQADERRFALAEFPPFSSWVVLTDMVSHAAVRGQHALVATWIVPLERCVAPELAPYGVISASGRTPGS
ncbi:MAG TPA: Kdo hydroxylase family protein [Planctomycetota bacterium]